MAMVKGSSPGAPPVREHGVTLRGESLWRAGFTAPLAAMAVGVVGLGVTASPYLLSVLTQAGIFAIAILGLNVLVGYTGQISFGHNAFLGIGAYVTALATTRWSLSPLVGLLTGLVVTAVVAVVVGYPTLKLRGHYLAMATFALGIGFYAFAVSSPLFNGYSGVAGIPPFAIGDWLVLNTTREKFLLVWAVAWVAVIVTWRLRHFRFGRALRSIAADEPTASALGIDVHRYKIVAFAISGAFASVAGSLYAHTVSFVSPETFSFATILVFFMMLFVGGLGTVWGSLVGALVVVVVPELMRDLEAWQPTVFGIALIAILILRPTGLFAPATGGTTAWGALLSRLRRTSGEAPRATGAGR
jgi:branched-chain amino acid transport system permease protein